MTPGSFSRPAAGGLQPTSGRNRTSSPLLEATAFRRWSVHCLLPVNGGARENWPRAGLEAMAAGVPVVAQNEWGWREMIDHGVTGFLGSCDEELAHYAATLAYDEDLRLRVANAAREKMATGFANPDVLAAAWLRVFESVAAAPRAAA